MNSNLVPLKNLELHVSHACNLSCESCSHYSNHHLKGNITLEEATEWMNLWNKRVAPQIFSLLGGEPTINPQLPEIIQLTREKWKDTKILLVTNGFFLHRQPDLPKVLKDAGNAKLSISIHHSSKDYSNKVEPNLALALEWKLLYNIDIDFRPSVKYWIKSYRGYGSAIAPFEDNNPQKSWEVCPAKNCMQLFEGKLWKCPPLAYLKLLNEKIHLSEKWNKYLEYEALHSSCTEEELRAFTEQKEIPECSMCSAKREYFELRDPS